MVSTKNVKQHNIDNTKNCLEHQIVLKLFLKDRVTLMIGVIPADNSKQLF